MFVVQGNEIMLHRGDTGTIGITASGYTFGNNDRALFTLKDRNGTLIKQGAYAMTNNRFEVAFENQDTDSLESGTYEWDVRYVVNPQYDQVTGAIVNGDAVATPMDPSPCVIRRTVGQI